MRGRADARPKDTPLAIDANLFSGRVCLARRDLRANPDELLDNRRRRPHGSPRQPVRRRRRRRRHVLDRRRCGCAADLARHRHRTSSSSFSPLGDYYVPALIDRRLRRDSGRRRAPRRRKCRDEGSVIALHVQERRWRVPASTAVSTPTSLNETYYAGATDRLGRRFRRNVVAGHRNGYDGRRRGSPASTSAPHRSRRRSAPR